MMKDSTRRGLRTALQLIVTLLTTGGIQGILALLGHAMSPEAYGTISAVLLPFITTGLNGLEDAGTIPAVLKAPASDGAEPVLSGEGGYARPGYALGIALVLIGVVVALTVSTLLGVILAVVGILVLCANVSYLNE